MSQNPISNEDWGNVANQVSNSDPQVITDWLNSLPDEATPTTNSDSDAEEDS